MQKDSPMSAVSPFRLHTGHLSQNLRRRSYIRASFLYDLGSLWSLKSQITNISLPLLEVVSVDYT